MFAIDQNLTVLAGVPRAQLLIWQGQLQQAAINTALAKNPQTLSYTQGDGSKSVSYNITSIAAAINMLMLVNRLLGFGAGRRPMRPYFR
jgi:hypothetical protein